MKLNMQMFAAFFLTTAIHAQNNQLAQAQTASTQNVYQTLREIVLSSCQKDAAVEVDPSKLHRPPTLSEVLNAKPVKKTYDEFTVYKHLFSLFSDIQIPLLNFVHSCVMDDFSIFAQKDSIFNAATHYVKTFAGKIFAAQVLRNPVVDVQILQNRQNTLKAFASTADQTAKIVNQLQIIKSAENAYISCFEKQDGLNQSTIDGYFLLKQWKKTQALNTSVAGHQTMQVGGRLFNYVTHNTFPGIIFGSYVYLVHIKGLPYEAFKTAMQAAKMQLGTAYVGMFGALIPLYWYLLYKAESKNNEVLNYMHTQMNDVASMIRAMRTIDTILQENPELKNRLDYADDLHTLFDAKNEKTSQQMRKLLSILSTGTFKSEPTFFSLRGRVLAAYAIMEDIKAEFARALHAVGEVDMYCGLAQLITQQAATDLPYTFVEYVENSVTPVIVLEDMWNPLINVATTSAHKIVKNSISLGVNGDVRNVIITGPNAGGKSTFMKGVGINVVLAQTFGIASAKSFVMTPFHNINSYMNITDNVQKGDSLFMAEVKAAHALYAGITELDKTKFSFSIVDELFSGTSPQEGADATYALARKMGTCDNSILLLATHFPKLKELAANTKNFKNCQVRVVRNADGTITYPFKLQDGFADQNVAFDILKQQGFNTSIFDDAHIAHVGA